MVQAFRLIAFLEGVSYILLLFIATPMKYFTGNDIYVKWLGMPHGMFFIAYMILAYVIRSEQNWSNQKSKHIFLASIIPFGTFWMERKYFGGRK